MVRAKRLTGIFPLAYMGVEPDTPSQFTVQTRSPTTRDYNNWNIGSIWLDISFVDPLDDEIWMLVDKKSQVATWVRIGRDDGELNTLTGDTGGVIGPDGDNNINTLSGFAPLSVDGNAGTFTLTINSDGTIATTYTTDSGSAVASAGVLNIVGGDDITVTGTGNTVTIDLDGTVTDQFDTDSGTAVPVLGVIDIAGGTGINTSGATSVVTVNLDIPVIVAHGGTGLTTITDHAVMLGSGTGAVTPTGVGTDGQVLIGATAADPVWGTITSTGGTITVTGGTNTLNIDTVASPGVGFSAYINSTVSNITGDGTIYSWIADTELFDVGSDYDHTTGIYTAPNTGKYFFGITLTVDGATSANADIQIFLFDSNSVDYWIIYGYYNNNIPQACFSGCVVIDLTAGDTILPKVEGNCVGGKILDLLGATTDPRYGSFFGYQLDL
jgi:hypothetical protein